MIKGLLVVIICFLSIQIGFSKLIDSYSCSILIGHAEIIAEGEITKVDSLYFKMKINQVFKGKIKVKEVLVEKNLKLDRYKLYKTRYDFWEVGQRELIFLNPEYNSLGNKIDSIFSVAHHYGDSEIPIISDTIYLSYWFGNHSENWKNKYTNYSLGKYYHLSKIDKRHKLEVKSFFKALKFCIKNNKRIIRKCKKDRLKNQKSKIINGKNNQRFKTTYWDGIIHDNWIKKHQNKSLSLERLLDEYYDGFVHLSPMKWNDKTYKANSGEFIKIE